MKVKMKKKVIPLERSIPFTNNFYQIFNNDRKMAGQAQKVSDEMKFDQVLKDIEAIYNSQTITGIDVSIKDAKIQRSNFVLDQKCLSQVVREYSHLIDNNFTTRSVVRHWRCKVQQNTNSLQTYEELYERLNNCFVKNAKQSKLSALYDKLCKQTKRLLKIPKSKTKKPHLERDNLRKFIPHSPLKYEVPVRERVSIEQSILSKGRRISKMVTQYVTAAEKEALIKNNVKVIEEKTGRISGTKPQKQIFDDIKRKPSLQKEPPVLSQAASEIKDLGTVKSKDRIKTEDSARESETKKKPQKRKREAEKITDIVSQPSLTTGIKKRTTKSKKIEDKASEIGFTLPTEPDAKKHVKKEIADVHDKTSELDIKEKGKKKLIKTQGEMRDITSELDIKEKGKKKPIKKQGEMSDVTSELDIREKGKKKPIKKQGEMSDVTSELDIREKGKTKPIKIQAEVRDITSEPDSKEKEKKKPLKEHTKRKVDKESERSTEPSEAKKKDDEQMTKDLPIKSKLKRDKDTKITSEPTTEADLKKLPKLSAPEQIFGEDIEPTKTKKVSKEIKTEKKRSKDDERISKVSAESSDFDIKTKPKKLISKTDSKKPSKASVDLEIKFKAKEQEKEKTVSKIDKSSLVSEKKVSAKLKEGKQTSTTETSKIGSKDVTKKRKSIKSSELDKTSISIMSKDKGKKIKQLKDTKDIEVEPNQYGKEPYSELSFKDLSIKPLDKPKVVRVDIDTLPISTSRASKDTEEYDEIETEVPWTYEKPDEDAMMLLSDYLKHKAEFASEASLYEQTIIAIPIHKHHRSNTSLNEKYPIPTGGWNFKKIHDRKRAVPISTVDSTLHTAEQIKWESRPKIAKLAMIIDQILRQEMLQMPYSPSEKLTEEEKRARMEGRDIRLGSLPEFGSTDVSIGTPPARDSLIGPRADFFKLAALDLRKVYCPYDFAKKSKMLKQKPRIRKTKTAKRTCKPIAAIATSTVKTPETKNIVCELCNYFNERRDKDSPLIKQMKAEREKQELRTYYIQMKIKEAKNRNICSFCGGALRQRQQKHCKQIAHKSKSIHKKNVKNMYMEPNSASNKFLRCVM